MTQKRGGKPAPWGGADVRAKGASIKDESSREGAREKAACDDDQEEEEEEEEEKSPPSLKGARRLEAGTGVFPAKRRKIRQGVGAAGEAAVQSTMPAKVTAGGAVGNQGGKEHLAATFGATVAGAGSDAAALGLSSKGGGVGVGAAGESHMASCESHGR